jgi:hypothetical protein
MERYVRWFARLGRFYRILLTGALLTGIAAIAIGTGTQNGSFVVIGLLWVLCGSAIVWVADRRERR